LKEGGFMMKTGVKEARQHFTEILARVEKGEEIIITKRDEPIAKISPMKSKAGGALKSRKGLRESLRVKGTPLSEIVLAARKKEAF
jgi:prevent-host-death family protein